MFQSLGFNAPWTIFQLERKETKDEMREHRAEFAIHADGASCSK